MGTGVSTWDGAVVLSKYFENHPELVQGKLVLELGSGTGVAGISAALLGARQVLLSDLAYTMDNLQSNVRESGLSNDIVNTKIVDWCDSSTYPISADQSSA